MFDSLLPARGGKIEQHFYIIFLGRPVISPRNQLFLQYIDYHIARVSEHDDEHVTIRDSDLGFFLYSNPTPNHQRQDSLDLVLSWTLMNY